MRVPWDVDQATIGRSPERYKSSLSASSSLSSSPTPSSHASAVVVVFVAGIVVFIIAVVVVVVGVWLSRVRELGGLIGASQCRVIAENGLDLTSIC